MQELTSYLGYEIGVAITGHENVLFTCIITEGFGRINIANHTFALLKSLEGKIASINGATQIRAGVVNTPPHRRPHQPQRLRLHRWQR